MPRRLTEPRPERAHERVNARIDRLEDTNTHFYNVIDELRERVSTLEKKLEHLRQ
jgi:prefoldin subunit 5